MGKTDHLGALLVVFVVLFTLAVVTFRFGVDLQKVTKDSKAKTHYVRNVQLETKIAVKRK